MTIRNNTIIFVLAWVLFFFSCKKGDDSVPDMQYDYFPINVGSYVIYDVTEIHIDQAVNHYDTTRYALKEKIESQFIDNQGRPSLRIERYWRTADTLAWVIKDVWYATRTSQIAEKVEENVRYIKMAFPVKENQQWNGNNYNTLDEWDYSYEHIGESLSLNSLSFDKTVKVLQRNNFNFVEYQQAWEIYAFGIGLVQKHYENLDINNGDPQDVRLGDILLQTATAYGME